MREIKGDGYTLIQYTYDDIVDGTKYVTCGRCESRVSEYAIFNGRCDSCRAIELFNETKREQEEFKRTQERKKAAKDRARDRSYRTKYGITLDDYNAMWQLQNGDCAICKRNESELNHILYVDHDHSTGAVRSLLCSKCNALVGVIETGDVRAAMDYIEVHSNV